MGSIKPNDRATERATARAQHPLQDWCPAHATTLRRLVHAFGVLADDLVTSNVTCCIDAVQCSCSSMIMQVPRYAEFGWGSKARAALIPLRHTEQIIPALEERRDFWHRHAWPGSAVLAAVNLGSMIDKDYLHLQTQFDQQFADGNLSSTGSTLVGVDVPRLLFYIIQ